MAPRGMQDTIFPVIGIDLEKVKVVRSKERSHSYEEALELAGFGRGQVGLMLLAGSCLMATMNESMIASFVLSAGHCDLGMDSEQIGMVGGAIFLGIMLSSYFWGYQADTRGRKPVLQSALFAASVCSVTSSFSTGFVSLLVLRFCTGLCISASSAIAYTYLGEFCTGQRRGQMVAYASVMISFGVVYASVISWWTLSYDWKIVVTETFSYRPWRLQFVLCTIPGLLVGVTLTFLPESPKFLLSQNRPNEALKVLQGLHRLNNGEANVYEVTKLIPEVNGSANETKGFRGVLESMKDQTIPLLKMPYLKNFVICCTNCVIAYSVYSLCLWFPQIMDQVLSNTSEKGTVACSILQKTNSNQTQDDDAQCNETIQQETYIYTILLGFIGMTCSLVLSFILRHFSSKSVTVCTVAIAGTAGILLQIVTNSYAVAVLFSVLITFSAMGVTLVNTTAVSLFPMHVKGMATSLINMMGRFGCFFFATVIGSMLAQNCPVTFYALSGLLFLSSALALLLP